MGDIPYVSMHRESTGVGENQHVIVIELPGLPITRTISHSWESLTIRILMEGSTSHRRRPPHPGWTLSQSYAPTEAGDPE